MGIILQPSSSHSTSLHRHLSPCPYSHCPSCSLSPVPRWQWHRDTDWCHTARQISHQNNIHLPAARPNFRALITDLTLCSPSGPSTPPQELLLSALDSSSVLISWRPPLEPNGIIISYMILHSINFSEPEHLWKNLSEDGRFLKKKKADWYSICVFLICNVFSKNHSMRENWISPFVFFRGCYQCESPRFDWWDSLLFQVESCYWGRARAFFSYKRCWDSTIQIW